MNAEEYTREFEEVISRAMSDRVHFVYRRIYSLADEQMYNRLMEVMNRMTYPDVEAMIEMYVKWRMEGGR